MIAKETHKSKKKTKGDCVIDTKMEENKQK